MSPQSLGPYELREEVSQGRSGAIHLAWDSCDEREVSVHMLSFGELGSRLRRRFEVEASALIQLDHPNLIHVLDHGLDEDGAPYLVRETVPGLSLEDLLELEGCMDPRHASELIAKVAGGLQAAHDVDLLHRDLNPASVIVDEAGEPRLTDFGLVRELSGDESAIRLKGRFLGTAGYLAPEQARAELHNLSVQTDVHGLGAILFALLTGRPPSSARTLIEAVDTLHEPPVGPSSHRPDLSPGLDAIVLRCLAKDSRARYSSAAELADTLNAWLDGPPPQQPVRLLPARALLGWLAVVAAVTPAAWGVGAWRLSRSLDQVAAAEDQAAGSAGTLRVRLDRIRGWIAFDPQAAADEALAVARAETSSPQAWSVAGLAALHAERWDDARRALTRALELDPTSTADRLTRGELLLAREALDVALADASTVLDARPKNNRALRLAARAALAMGDAQRSSDHASECVAIYPNDPEAWEVLGRARLELDNIKGALGAATRLRQLAPERGENLLELIRFHRRN